MDARAVVVSLDIRTLMRPGRGGRKNGTYRTRTFQAIVSSHTPFDRWYMYFMITAVRDTTIILATPHVLSYPPNPLFPVCVV